MARFGKYEIALRAVFGNLNNMGVGQNLGNCVFYHEFGARFRQTRFFDTQEREYACPVAWGLRQKFKIEKCWIFTLTTFSDRLYINRGHPAMGIAISILPIHRDGGLLCYIYILCDLCTRPL